MKAGKLVPDSMIIKLILAELTGHGWLKSLTPKTYTLNSSSTASADVDSHDDVYEACEKPSSSFILDGFPRTASQASKLDDLIPINLVVHLNTPTAIILERIANRWVHAPSGRVYNTTFNPPKVPGKDDVTGEALSRREDDCPDTWRKRLQSFDETSAPLLEHYDKMGLLWRVDGNSSDEITPKLLSEFGRRFGVQAMAA
jgi:adenylate kinase